MPDPRKVRQVKLPAAVHAQAVELSPRVLAKWPERAPDHYQKAGPGVAIHAGLAMLRSVLDGHQELAPPGTAADLEAASEAARYHAERAAIFSILMVSACWQVAELNEDPDPEKRGVEIAAELVRAFVSVEIMEREHAADETEAAALRDIAADLLLHADELTARAAEVRRRSK